MDLSLHDRDLRHERVKEYWLILKMFLTNKKLPHIPPIVSLK